MYEYLVPSWERFQPDYEKGEVALHPYPSVNLTGNRRLEPTIDRSPKLYIGGKQTRSDSGYSFTVEDADGNHISETGLGNRKTSECRRGCRQSGKLVSHHRAPARADSLLSRRKSLGSRSRIFESTRFADRNQPR